LIKMSAVWAAGMVGLLLLCLGALVGSSLTVQALNRQHCRLATERRKLYEWRRELQEASLALTRCAWCADSTALFAGDYEDGRYSETRRPDPHRT
jgi:hypothetical protein